MMRSLHKQGFIMLMVICPLVTAQLHGGTPAPPVTNSTELDTTAPTPAPTSGDITVTIAPLVPANSVNASSDEEAGGGGEGESGSAVTNSSVPEIPIVENEMDSGVTDPSNLTNAVTSLPAVEVTTMAEGEDPVVGEDTTSPPDTTNDSAATDETSSDASTLEPQEVDDSTLAPSEEPVSEENAGSPTEQPSSTEGEESAPMTAAPDTPGVTISPDSSSKPETTTLSTSSQESEVTMSAEDASSATPSQDPTTVSAQSNGSSEAIPESGNTTSNSSVAPSEVSQLTEVTELSENISEITEGDDPEVIVSESASASCIGTMEKNVVMIVAIVVGVNVLSICLTACLVYRLASRRLSWDPPPVHYNKQRDAVDHPVATPRRGINLATDVECRTGEAPPPTTQIPIVITSEDGWCVPYSDQEKKKKNNAENNTEDTGV